MRLQSPFMQQWLPWLGITFLMATTTLVTADPPLSPRLQCKCQPDEPCWPSASAWAALNTTVDGRLIATRPVAWACHHRPPPDGPSQEQCEYIQPRYYSGAWRQRQPGAFQQSNWETFHGQGCLLNQTITPCVQGAVPLYTVNVSTIAHVQAAVRFAAQHRIRLVVKNTGHDYLGRSTAAGSLSIWTYFNKDISVVDTFVPEGAPQDIEGTHAVVLGAGVIWKDAYEAVDRHGRVVVGGMAATVGTSGGYCLSGGHSALSPRHGLCVDNVLQYRVVTADGEVRVANAYQNQDLFWALRGGGPGFGVVVEAVYRTHPAPARLQLAVVIVASNDTAQMDKVARNFYGRIGGWTEDHAWSGYATIAKTYLGAAMIMPDTTTEAGQAGLQPFVDYARSLGPNVEIINNTVTELPSYPTLMSEFDGSDFARNAAVNVVLGSRLIPRAQLATPAGIGRLTSTMNNVLDDLQEYGTDQYLVLMVAGGQVAQQNKTGETSVVPGWRQAQLLINYSVVWQDDTPYAEQQRRQRVLTKATDRLRRLMPNAGTYQNEADPNEPQFQQSFFGANYPRLYQLKHKYDPHGLFVCRRCVGSEDWNTDGTCPRRR